MNGLGPAETKIVLAKIAAFQALETHRKVLVCQKGFSSLEVQQLIASTCDHGRALKSESPRQFLKTYCDALAGTMALQRPTLRAALTGFAETLRNSIEAVLILERNLNQWIQAMIKLAAQFSMPMHPIKGVSLEFEVEQDPILAFYGRTSKGAGNTRVITLILHPGRLSEMDVFSIPLVLSHEFWCHCLSDLKDPDKSGCHPSASFEEGWMDHVQKIILRENISRITGISQLADLDPHWTTYEEARRRHLPDNVKTGHVVAAAFEEFLLSRLDENEEDPRKLFRRISLELNATVLHEDHKGAFVDAIAQRLIPETTLFGGTLLDAQAVQERRELAAVLKKWLASANPSVDKLLKLL